MTQSRETLRKGSGTMPLQRALSQVGSGKKHANASCSGICPGGCRNHRVVAHGCCARRSTIQGLRYGLQRRCSQVVSPQTAPKRSPRSGWQAMCRCAVGGLHGWADATLPDLAVWADQETPVVWTAMRAGALHDAACIGRPGLGSAVGSVKGWPRRSCRGVCRAHRCRVLQTALRCLRSPCSRCRGHRRAWSSSSECRAGRPSRSMPTPPISRRGHAHVKGPVARVLGRLGRQQDCRCGMGLRAEECDAPPASHEHGRVCCCCRMSGTTSSTTW